MKPVTVCLTSCNKFNLLKRTLDSFFSYNTYPIDRFLIIEDSTNPMMKQRINSHYSGKVELIMNETKLCQIASIDKIYGMVNTEYIFHCEDDWLFTGRTGFIEKSMSILEERPDVHQVWIRNISQGHRDNLIRIIEPQILSTTDNIKYKLLQSPHDGRWCGFSWNPGLRRLSDYKKFFPDGFSKFIVTESNIPHVKPNALSEFGCSGHALDQGYRAATLLDEYCTHIG